MNDIFVKASRLKLRFNSGKGPVTVEDLWVLPLTKLDEIASELDDVIGSSAKKSRLTVKTTENETASLQLAIVEYVIETRQAEQKAKTDKAAHEQEVSKLQELLNKKKDQALDNLSVEQIEALLAAKKA